MCGSCGEQEGWNADTCYECSCAAHAEGRYNMDETNGVNTVIEWAHLAAEAEADTCPCGGTGYMSHPNDVWVRCWVHHTPGQAHPEDYEPAAASDALDAEHDFLEARAELDASALPF